MIFREIAFGSNTFREECELRQKLLRQPLGLDLYAEDLNEERLHRHFGLFDGGVLVACVIAVLLSPEEAKIRQMAVGSEYQGRGIGQRTIRELESHLLAAGVSHASMHARLSAVGFYEKLGYRRSGGEFIEVGIPHVKMEKHLAKRENG